MGSLDEASLTLPKYGPPIDPPASQMMMISAGSRFLSLFLVLMGALSWRAPPLLNSTALFMG